MYVVTTREAARMAGENGRNARLRRAHDRANGTATSVRVVTHYVPGSTEMHFEGQRPPILVHDAQEHHPRCRTTAERPSLCDCNEFEWWQAGKAR